jgi:glycosyltransferase involved in cell wall biosynthesis
MHSLSVIVPTYNEAENIVALLESVKSVVNNSIITEIIVVDDNSLMVLENLLINI